jgi:hypothetical protein
LCKQLNNGNIERDFRFANINCGSRLHLCCGLFYLAHSTADTTRHSIMTAYPWIVEIWNEAVVV